MLESVKNQCNNSQRIVLDLLCAAYPGGVSNGQFAQSCSLRYGGRIHELMPMLAEHGWCIAKELRAGRTWVYRLSEILETAIYDTQGQYLIPVED